MSNTKFTPGPWNVDPDYINDVQAGGLEVARCPSIGAAGDPAIYPYNAPHDDEADANAHLIAAAPDLYYLLTGILEEWQNRFRVEFSAAIIHNNSDGVGIHFDYAQMPAVPEWVNKAKEVLAKARGEAQPEQEEDHPSDGDRLLDELHANAPTPYDP